MKSFEKELVAGLVILGLVFIGLVSFVPVSEPEIELDQEPAYFTISSWLYPSDNYGQGIFSMSLYENSTGSWVLYETFYNNRTSQEFEWNASVAVKLLVGVWVNTTRLGVATENEVLNRTIVSLTISNTTGVFYSATNMTFYYKITAQHPMWFLVFTYDSLTWLPEQSEIYTLTVTMRTYYAVW